MHQPDEPPLRSGSRVMQALAGFSRVRASGTGVLGRDFLAIPLLRAVPDTGKPES